ncbi:MAG: VWA domain-containing protein [Myxococcales bacterium]|nr:VWA domain-containing protein [Myxococcales bacterium]
MTLAGLPLAQLLAIFGAAAALVTVFYILKLRRRAVAVPFSPLWNRILRDKEATSLFSKLKRLLSLLLQLALLVLLVLALGDPRAAASLVKGRNLVVLVDASASMQATDVSGTRLGSAKDEVRKMIRGLGGADRMLIAQMDAVTTALVPMSGDTAELERSLDRISATDTRVDFARALRFATDAVRGLERSEIVVVSDGNVGEAADASGAVRLGDAKLVYVPVGRGKRNVAITQFSVRRYPLDKSRYEVMLEVTNTSDTPEDVELSLFGDGVLVDLSKLRLAPGERLPRFYPNLSGASRALEARLGLVGGGHDDLPADDRAYALLPERRRAKVLVVSDGNTYLEAALLLDEYLDVTQVKPKDYAHAASSTYDVAIFDGATPAELPKAHALYLDPRGSGSPVKVGPEIDWPAFDKVDGKHPVARFLALESVGIRRAHRLTLGPGDRALGAVAGAPVLASGVRGGFKFVALGFDVRESDLPLRVAWPLFLVNTINWFTDEDASYLSSFRTGEVWRITAQGEGAATLTMPEGEHKQVPIHEGRAVFLGTRAGFYELESGGGAKTSFAANLLDVTESTIAPAPELVVDGQRAAALAGFQLGVRREIWVYLLILAVLLTALEWATYHRRLTV